MAAGSIRPLVVCAPDGRPVGVLEENEKGFRKTLEQGHLWALHPGTGRLLPFHEETSVTIADHGTWYEAVLSEDVDPGSPAASGGVGPEAVAPEDGDTGTTPAVPAGAARIGPVLADLAALIARRHAELPEGSYTTHLFTSGPEKIRKKAGEEAVELLLASTRETLASETADLLYHLLVLLESEGISLDEIAVELEKR
ncbi:MAG: phosphoribosyl-ATP diphosphatase [Spirochaetota bacterium]